MSRPPGIRTCVVCGRRRAKDQMLRLVVDDKGVVIADPEGTRVGRGAYVCESCVPGLARIKPVRWQRLFRRNRVVFVPDGVLDAVAGQRGPDGP